ncbi:MAG: tetratricopeptide repeat protein [Candidatus Obscuribacterales bacterium]|nr:tetratricopeptide repeat protein [Candidatus Obscuribacterales bacterium]
MSTTMSSTSSTGRYPGDILIGDLMVKAGVISAVQLDEAVKLAGNKHLQLGQMLIMAGHISPRDLQAAVDAQSMLRDRAMDQNMATRCLKIACKTGMNFVDVFRDQDGAKTSGAVSNKLGELLLEANLIDREQFGKSMQRSLATGLPLGRILVLNGALSETVLNTALEIQVRLRDGMLSREEAVEALRGQIGDMDPEEAQRQTLTLQTVLSNPPRKRGIRLGELMVLAGLLNETDVMNALELGLVNEQPIGEVMVNQGFLTNEMLEYALELQKKVDSGDLQPTEAGQVLAKISANGIPLDEAIAEFIAPQEPVYETLTFDRMLVLSRVITDEQIDESFNRAIASPQILAKLLVLTEHISNPAMQAVLQCYSMMSNNFLSQDDAIIALDYCLNESAERNITFGEALQELGWSATQSIQMQAQNSVAVTHIKLQAMMHPDGSLAAPEEVRKAPLSHLDSEPEEDNGYTAAMAEQEAANEDSAWLPDDSVAEAPSESASEEYAADDSENFKVRTGNLVTDDSEGQGEESIEPENQPYAESVEMQEAQELVDPAENYEESQVVNTDDDADFSEVFEVDHSEEKEPLADSIDEEFSNDEEIASSASVPSEEHVAIVPGEDDAAENEAFREEFSLDSEDIVKETELALPVEPPSLAELMGQAKALEDKMAAESEHTMDEAKSKFEKEVQKDEALRAERITADTGASKGSGSLKDLFKPDASGDDSKSGGNGHTPVIQPAAVNAPSPLAAVASTSTSVAAEASNLQAPKALGDLFKANTSTSENAEVAATAAASSESRPSAIQALLGSDSTPAKPAASSLPSPNSLHAMLSKGSSASTSSSSSGVSSSTTNIPIVPTPSAAPAGGLSGLLAGMAPAASTAAQTTSSSALQALTPVPVTPPPAPVDSTKSEPIAKVEPEAVKEASQSAARALAPVEEKEDSALVAPAKAAESVPARIDVVEEPTPAPVPGTSKPVESVAPAEPKPLVEGSIPAATPAPAAIAAAAQAPVPTPAAVPVPTPAPIVPQAPPQQSPVSATVAPVVPPPLTAAVQPAQEQPVPAADPAHQAFDDSANRLAESYYEQGNFAEAQKLYERVLAAKEQQFGATHQSLGADLTNLAGVMCVQGLFQQAEPYVRRVVMLIEHAEPLDLLKLADSLNTLAGILFQQGKFADCEPLLGRALKLRQQKLGSEHPDIADNLRDYAKLLRKLQREEEAEFMYAQAKAILAKRPPPPPRDDDSVS